MFYGQCWKCGERWGLGTASACKCPNEEPVAYEPVWSSGPTNKDMEDAMRQRRLNELATSSQPKAAQWLTEERYAELHTAQRTWVGLTDEEIEQGLLRSNYALQTAHAWRAGVVFAMTKLKEKNNV